MTELPCLECGKSDHKLGTGARAYPHRPDLHAKLFWFCSCGAFVGCHPGTNKALGAPAGQLTKWARMDAHKHFDKIWQSKTMGRKAAYKWLADALGIEPKSCHIGNMDRDMAKRVVVLCKERNASES